MAVKRKSPRGDAKLSVRTPKKRGGVGGGGARNPNSLANLRPPWQPGQPSPNPGGRPKALGEAYRRWLEHIDPQTGLTNADMIANAIGRLALRGDVKAAHEIRASTEPKRVEVTGAEGRPLFDPMDLTDEQLAIIAAGARDPATGGVGTAAEAQSQT